MLTALWKTYQNRKRRKQCKQCRYSSICIHDKRRLINILFGHTWKVASDFPPIKSAVDLLWLKGSLLPDTPCELRKRAEKSLVFHPGKTWEKLMKELGEE